MIAIRYRCEKCKGNGFNFGDTGTYYKTECPSCDGTGFTSDQELRKKEREKDEKLKEENIITKSKLNRIQKILEE